MSRRDDAIANWMNLSDTWAELAVGWRERGHERQAKECERRAVYCRARADWWSQPWWRRFLSTGP